MQVQGHLVIRDGETIRIPGREVVTGDIVILQEGDRVPADAMVLRNNNLLADESLLTGESVPVRKRESGKRGILSSYLEVMICLLSIQDL